MLVRNSFNIRMPRKQVRFLPNATSLIRTNRLISESIAAVDLSVGLDGEIDVNGFQIDEESKSSSSCKHFDLTKPIRLNRGLVLMSLKIDSETSSEFDENEILNSCKDGICSSKSICRCFECGWYG